MDARIVQEIAEATGSSTVILPSKSAFGTHAQSTSNRMSPAANAAAIDYFDSPDRLHGDRMPSTNIVHEKAVHRMMVYLSASGALTADIAAQTGYTACYVSNVLRQPWARERLVQILNETGRDMVKHFLTNEVRPSLEVLREIRDDSSAAKNARIIAANSILDRALGKPIAKVETDNTNRSVPADTARLDAEIASIRKQLSEHASDTPSPSQN